MSMSTWDASAVSNGENGNFDPSMGFGANMNATDFDPSRLHNNQTPNLQFQQQMPNGSFRHGSPPQNQMFQTSSVVPSKRPHSEYSASPSQVSRAQTPQQGQGGAYPGYNPAANGQQAHNQFQHLQQPNSSTASPSPVMQHQNFNQHNMAQRMSTASPAPFSPAGQSFGQQGSPTQIDQSGQFESSANGNNTPMQGTPQGQGQNPNQQSFSPTPGNMQGSPQQFAGKGLTPEQQRMMYEQRLRQFPPNSAMAQQQRAQMNAMNQMNMMGGMNAMGGGPGPNPGMTPQQQQQQAARNQMQQMQRMMMPSNPQQFVNAVASFMQSRQMPFNPTPMICGRQCHSVQIYSTVMKNGGSRRMSASSQWPRVAQSLGFQPPQIPQAASELSTYWQSNLFPYEMTLLQNMQNQQRMAAGGQMQQPGGSRMQMENGHMQGSPPPNQPPQPSQQGSPVSIQTRRQSSTDAGGLTLPGSNLQQGLNAVQANGLPASRDGQMPAPQTGGFPPNAMYGPKSAKAAPGSVPASADGLSSAGPGQVAFVPESVKTEVEQPPSVPETFEALSSAWERHESSGGILAEDDGIGGRVLAPETFTNQAQHIAWLIERYGVDIMDLTMRIKSGLPGEVRWALDFLSVSSVRREAPLNLQLCEDLVDSLLDCAEDAMEHLANNAADESDSSTLTSYEELIRGCESEESDLLDVHEPGSLEYSLENSAERLLCVVSLLRTWSTVEVNVEPILSDGSLVRFLATAIRHLSTRQLLLCTSERTLELMKDLLVLLSNVSLHLELGSKDEVVHFVEFLLAFAPEPLSSPLDGDVRFPLYKPSVHHHLPLAVDVLAKLLAHGDPNRTYLKSVLLADCGSETSQELLTRAFGLAVSVVPCELYRSGLKLQLQREEDQKETPKAKALAKAKAAMKASAKATSETNPSAKAQLRQLKLQSKLEASVKAILNDQPDSELAPSRKEIQLLGPGKSTTGKWTAKLPCLVSGMLAAEILLSLIPNSRPELIRSWVASPDGLVLRLQKFVINSGHPASDEPAFPGNEVNGASGPNGQPTSAREDLYRPRTGNGSLYSVIGFLPGELPEDEDPLASPTDGHRPGSSDQQGFAADGSLDEAPRDPRTRPPTSEAEAVAQMELDASTRCTRILRRIRQRTSKAARPASRAANPALNTAIDA